MTAAEMLQSASETTDAATMPKPANGTASTSGSADATTSPKKKLHGRAFYESIGSPKYIVAPMVDQSEFVCRRDASMWPFSRNDTLAPFQC